MGLRVGLDALRREKCLALAGFMAKSGTSCPYKGLNMTYFKLPGHGTDFYR